MKQLDLDVKITLLAAAHLIRKTGWTRGVMTDALGRKCLRGAIRTVVRQRSQSEDDVQRYDELCCKAMAAHIPAAIKGGDFMLHAFDHLGGSRVIAWNDTCCTDTAMAASLLERAAGVA
jgi:hypothetical protein